MDFSTSVLITDPVTDTADTTTISGLPGAGSKWSGGVLAPNGQIYGLLYDSTSVLINSVISDRDMYSRSSRPKLAIRSGL